MRFKKHGIGRYSTRDGLGAVYVIGMAGGGFEIRVEDEDLSARDAWVVGARVAEDSMQARYIDPTSSEPKRFCSVKDAKAWVRRWVAGKRL